MCAAIDDIHHRYRQLSCATATEVLVKRQAAALGSRVGGGKGYREHGVGAHRRFIFGAVGVDQALIDAELIASVEVFNRFGEGAVDVIDRA